MRLLAGVLPLVCLLWACTPQHPRRVGTKQLNRLLRNNDKFVVVFGSVKALQAGRDVTDQGAGAGAAIRFGHNDPASTLLELPVPNGQRFYVVLQAPDAQRYLDNFSVQVRWMDAEYDPLTFVRLSDRPAFAFYLGEIEMTVAEGSGSGKRVTPRQILSVSVRNDFVAAAEEMKRIYPRFTGELIRSPLLDARPAAPTPPRKIG